MNSLYKQIYVTKKEPLVIEVSQGTTLPLIELEIADWNIPSGSTAQIYVEKPSGALIYNVATIDGNTIQIEPTTQMTIETGINKGQIRLINGEDVLHTFVFYLKVYESIIDDSAIESTNEFTALEEALSEVQNFVPKTAVASKGSATQPIYFDSNGVAQNTTYPLKLNTVTQAGLVSAPTSSKVNYLYDTDASGNPVWSAMDDILTRDYRKSTDGSSFSKNFLTVNPSQRFDDYKKKAYFYWDQSTKSNYSNIPTLLDAITIGSVLGYREVFYRSNIHILVVVTEMFPFTGRQHFNFYNNGSWSGWQCSKPARRLAYTVSGYLMDSSSGTVKGYGAAKYQQLESTAVIDFEVQVTTAGSVGTDYTPGISVATLQGLNSSIPDITPLNGIIHYYTSAGALDTSKEGYAGMAVANVNTKRWGFGRVYSTSGQSGNWSDSGYTAGMRINGTLYGEINY